MKNDHTSLLVPIIHERCDIIDNRIIICDFVLDLKMTEICKLLDIVSTE